MSDIPIYFYLPKGDRPPFEVLPTAEEMDAHPKLFLSPAVNWVWRTHHHLAQAGAVFELTDQLPQRGIIVCAACNLPLLFRPGPEQFMVNCVADSPPRFFTQVQLFQSRSQARTYTLENPGNIMTTDMPHWPQPGLLPRNRSRGARFETLDYFGAANQLDPALRTDEFRQSLAAMGIQFRTHFEHYHDYRDTDAVLAVRQFGETPINHKPASKLINAWLAGVPALLGAENGFRELRQSSDDYLEVTSIDDILTACRRLKQDGELQRRMMEQGAMRARDYAEDQLTERWKQLLLGPVKTKAQQWFAAPRYRHQAFFLGRAIQRFSLSLKRRLSRSSSPAIIAP